VVSLISVVYVLHIVDLNSTLCCFVPLRFPFWQIRAIVSVFPLLFVMRRMSWREGTSSSVKWRAGTDICCLFTDQIKWIYNNIIDINISMFWKENLSNNHLRLKIVVIRNVPSSDLVLQTGSEVFRCICHQSVSANAEILSQMKPSPSLPSTSFPIHCWLISVYFDSIYPELLTASLNTSWVKQANK
jgi:hypothetical protein